jgi:hypothetical protein
MKEIGGYLGVFVCLRGGIVGLIARSQCNRTIGKPYLVAPTRDDFIAPSSGLALKFSRYLISESLHQRHLFELKPWLARDLGRRWGDVGPRPVAFLNGEGGERAFLPGPFNP